MFSKAAKAGGRYAARLVPLITKAEVTTVPCRAFSTATADHAKEACQKTAQSSWAGPAAGAAVVGAGLFYYFTRPAAAKPATEEPDEVDPNSLKTGTAPDKPVALHNFKAVDHTGADFTLEQLKGDFAMLVFGVTRDVDDARERLENLSEVVRQSDRKSNLQSIRALFVSEEPDQDAPEKMGALVEKYEKKSSRPSRIVGLTGPDVNQVRQMVNQFNQKSVTEGKTEVVEAGDPNGTLFLINPEGKLVAGFKYAAHGVDTKQVAEAIASEVRKYMHANPSWLGPKKVTARHA